MIINDTRETIPSRVNLVSYTGKYPNYCSGELTLDIDGEEYLFGNWWPVRLRPEGACEKFWHMDDGEWLIDYEKLPDEIKEYADEIDAIINEALECRHCGGCR